MPRTGNNPPDLAKRLIDLCCKYAYTLSLHSGLDSITCLVLLHLFESKIFRKRPAVSAYKAYTELHACEGSLIPLYGKPWNVSEKNVSQALETLVSRGYVLKISPTKISKKGKKRKGRQPSYLYKLKSIQEIIKSVKRDLVEKQRAILGVLDQMSEIEEAAAASREEEYSIEV